MIRNNLWRRGHDPAKKTCKLENVVNRRNKGMQIISD